MTEPPDGGDPRSEGGTEPCLPSSLAAAVKAGHQESREARPSRGNMTGDMLDSVVKEVAEDSPRLETGGAWGGLPPPGGENTAGLGTAGQLAEEEATKEGGGTPGAGALGTESEWQIARKRQNKGAGRTLMQEQNRETPMVYEEREGDWKCKSRGCENFMNFRRRTQCMRCKRDKNGEMNWNQIVQEGSVEGRQTPGTRYRERAEERGQLVLRQPKLSVVVVNITFEGKDNHKLIEDDHYEVIKQAGLSMGEVRGKFAKPGYLEVGMIPGASSISRAVREHPKEVNKSIMITSVRERGTNRPILIKWAEVPFMIPDETIINYMRLWAKIEGGGMSMRWERSKEDEDKSPGGELVGSFTAERTSRVTLNANITHLPTWHYVGGARIKLVVPGKKNCGHCLKSVGECESGGLWSRCRDRKTPRGNWKDDLEVFLRTQCDGWDDQKQKEMESLEKKDVEAATAGDDEEVELRLEEERDRLEEEAKEGLVQQVAEDKTCGGLLLKDMPEEDGGKSMTKEEALLTVIYASRLDDQEAERMRTAEAKILPKRERAKKGTVDLKITLEGADQLLRKVWRNLEKACKQEGVKRYQLEAISVLLPVRKKPPTVFKKSRDMAREQLEEEQRKERKRREEEKAKQEEEKKKEGQSARQVADMLQGETEQEGVDIVKIVEKEADGQQEEIIVDSGKEASLRLNIREEEKSDDSEEEVLDSQSEMGIPRVKKPIWMAQEGYGRCGKGCEGCAAKCEQQKLENCHNCHLNLLKNTSSYGCHNRKACLEPKPKLVKGSTEKGAPTKKLPVKGLNLGYTTKIDKSSSPLVQMKILQFSGKGDDEESRKRDIERSPGDSPPEKSQKESKIPGLHVSQKTKGKGKSPSSKHSSF